MLNVDPKEVNKFNMHAAQWWNPQGEFKTLHAINPLRVAFIQEQTELSGKTLLDIGCGGGILAESLAKAGANVTGIDMAEAVLQVACEHAAGQHLKINYQSITAENLATQQPANYDVITCLEMLEHVPDPTSIIEACSQLLKPGGKVFFSTINRNFKAYLFTVLGAEYLLKWLPIGTHDYNKFIRPSELATWARPAGLQLQQLRGISYSVLTQQFSLSNDVSVNYLAMFEKV